MRPWRNSLETILALVVPCHGFAHASEEYDDEFKQNRRDLSKPATPMSPAADWMDRLPALNNGQLAPAPMQLLLRFKVLVHSASAVRA